MLNIIFYDIKPYEQSFFEKELINDFNIIFKTEQLTSETTIYNNEEKVEVISVFTSSRVDKDVLQKFKNLKLILTRSVGYSHIDIDYCNENNIVVANTPHYGDYTVSEYSFGLLLSLIRKICYAQNELKNGDMYPETYGMELFNKTIGIIGTGAIGSKSVKIANGFSMNVLCYDICPDKQLESSFKCKYVDIDTICKFSDIITLHLPLTPQSYHLIDSQKISLMKESAIIVNTARGELIDTEALYDALLFKRIRAAALDVLEFEETIQQKQPGQNLNLKNLRTSLINNKLLTLSNVIATPHVAYDTQEAIDRILSMTLDSIQEFLSGKEIHNKI